MRICGRTLRPSTLAERRVLLALGFPTMRVPRGMNPFIVARRVGRLAKGHTDDHVFHHKATPPSPQPEPDTTEPVGPELMPVHASAA
jgi:hypothetical protein